MIIEIDSPKPSMRKKTKSRKSSDIPTQTTMLSKKMSTDMTMEKKNGKMQGNTPVGSTPGVHILDILVMIVSTNDGKKKIENRYFYQKDQLGSITAITDKDGKVVEEYKYDAFGKVYIRDGKSDNWRGFKESKVGNVRLFTGREYDREIGLYYYRARYYSTELGRFISRDPIGMSDNINLYSYVGNNPVRFVDAMGREKQIVAIDTYFYTQINNVINQPWYNKINPLDFIGDTANEYNFKLKEPFYNNDYSKQVFTVEGSEIRGDEMGNFFIGFNGAEHGINLPTISIMAYGGQYIAEVSDNGAGYLEGLISAANNEGEDNIWYIAGYIYNQAIHSSTTNESFNKGLLQNLLIVARQYSINYNK